MFTLDPEHSTMPLDESHLQPYRLQLEGYKETAKNPLPTPPVGSSVAWYSNGKKDDPEREHAAIVTKIQDSGKISLIVFRPNAMPIHKTGVYFHEHQSHAKPSNAETMTNGCWDYPKFSKVPKEHYDYHLKQLSARMEAVQQQIQTLSQTLKEPVKA